jgi:glycosyltransferase involved in cell wall biosynthesis
MRILFLSAWFPYPVNNGSKLRIFNLLRELSAQHEIILLSFTEEKGARPDAPALKELCVEVHTVRKRRYTPHSLHALLGTFRRFPRSVYDKFSSEMARLIKRTVREDKIDLVIASQVDMAGYYDCFNGVPAIFEEIEIGVLYEQYALAGSLKKKLRYWLTWQKHRAYLVELMRHFQAATVVSEREKELLRAHVLSNSCLLRVIPNGVNMSDYVYSESEVALNTLIFTGSFSFSPNYEAMIWFLREVFPLVLEEVPDTHLIITGKHGNRPLPSTQNVTLTGFVDDIRPYVMSAAVSLAPIWTGGGTRLKILEAMALGTAVVATSKGAEGLNVQSGKHIFLADEPVAFARAIVKVLQNPNLRKKLADNAQQHLRNNYDWSVIMPQLFQLIEEITPTVNTSDLTIV